MTAMPAAWRMRWWRWALPLALVLANAALLVVHPGRTGAGFADTERVLAREAERLTRLINEVKKLAQRAGLEPQSISYPEETLDEYGLVRMSLVFGVQGTYPQLRMLVNLLERSDLFLVLDQIALTGSAKSVLSISLQISTFFAREAGSIELPQPDEAAPPPRPARGRARS
jgi:Tfp pilus assembly protein PilO